jgi:hypothetical protein
VGGNIESYEQELMKNAWMFQHPNEHLHWATVLMGEEGAGKNSFYTDVICSLWGDEWTSRNITSMETITDNKNKTTIAYKKLIVCNEVSDVERNRASFDVLKSRITDDYYNLRNLCQDLIEIRNVNNYIFCTNNYNSIKLGQRDRRYFILEVSDKYVGKIAEYFTPLAETFTDEMKTHLLKFFLEYDITRFNPRIPPLTDLKRELLNEQKPFAQLFIEEMELPEDGICLDVLWERYIEYCDRNAVDHKYIGRRWDWEGRSQSSLIRRFRRLREKQRGSTTRKDSLLLIPLQPRFSGSKPRVCSSFCI